MTIIRVILILIRQAQIIKLLIPDGDNPNEISPQIKANLKFLTFRALIVKASVLRTQLVFSNKIMNLKILLVQDPWTLSCVPAD